MYFFPKVSWQRFLTTYSDQIQSTSLFEIVGPMLQANRHQSELLTSNQFDIILYHNRILQEGNAEYLAPMQCCNCYEDLHNSVIFHFLQLQLYCGFTTKNRNSANFKYAARELLYFQRSVACFKCVRDIYYLVWFTSFGMM